ncbi:hypothetical protein [Psychrobacillus sp. L4]|uniref:hypothetical protein n=1 Tax=Psychrobacillus sp. L4 TaxID=3236892 RepID=UPI0036F1B837
MATSSFDKVFTLETEEAVESFVRIVNNPKKSVEIDRSVTAPEKVKQGEERLKRMLSR